MAPVVEMIDVVDENGVPTGGSKPRSSIHRDGDWHRTVHVWLTNRNGEVLFQKRALTKESFPGLWDVSAAGHIESGETSAAAAAKELREELGIDVCQGDLRFLFSVKNTAVLRGGAFVDNEISDVYLVRLDIEKSKINVQPSEVSTVKFVKATRLARLAENRVAAFVPHEREYGQLYGHLLALAKKK